MNSQIKPWEDPEHIRIENSVKDTRPAIKRTLYELRYYFILSFLTIGSIRIYSHDLTAINIAITLGIIIIFALELWVMHLMIKDIWKSRLFK